MKHSFTHWLIVLGALGVASVGVGALLWFQQAELAARWVFGLGALGVAGWLIWGLIYWREVPRVRRLATVILSTVTALLLAAICWTLQWREGVVFVLSAWTMGMVFVLGLGLLRMMLSPGWPMIGVARTLLDEAIRMKAPLIFIIMLVLLVPMLPLVISAQDTLQNRLETFLTWSMMVVSGLLSLMTIFLAVGSVSNELGQRQIFMTLTKPVGRGKYLLGKWLGIILLDMLLVIVSGAGIYGFARLLEHQDARDQADRRAVNDEVLTARTSVSPTPVDPAALQSQTKDRLERLRQSDPHTYGQPGDPLDALPNDLRNQLRQQVLAKWYSLGPRDRKTFRFTGLSRAAQLAQAVQFRLKPTAASQPPDKLVRLAINVNGRILPSPTGRRVWSFVHDQYDVIEIPTAAVDSQGRLDLELFNAPRANGQTPPSVSFNLDDGLELLYKVSSFEANLGRAMAMVWIRLCFLTMLGIFASTFLGFPVACMLCALVYFAAAGQAYLNQSFEFYVSLPKDELPAWERVIAFFALMWDHVSSGAVWEAIKMVIKAIGLAVTFLIPSFADYSPTQTFAHGRLVPWTTLGRAVLFVGGLWTGTLTLAAWLIFRKKELAKITT